MTGKIFINYRRGDSSAWAGRISDWLQDEFGRGQVFIDVGQIKPGEDFVEAIEGQVAQSDAMLSIIGPTWACDGKDPDFVRLEIEAALARQKLLIPVLVDGGKMPRLDLLPENLRPFARRSAALVRHESFDPDMRSIATLIRESAGVANSEEREDLLLKQMRMQMLSAPSARDIRRIAYELDDYLAKQPHSVKARMLKDQIEHVLLTAENMEAQIPKSGMPDEIMKTIARMSKLQLTIKKGVLPLVLVILWGAIIAYALYRFFFQ